MSFPFTPRTPSPVLTRRDVTPHERPGEGDYFERVILQPPQSSSSTNAGPMPSGETTEELYGKRQISDFLAKIQYQKKMSHDMWLGSLDPRPPTASSEPQSGPSEIGSGSEQSDFRTLAHDLFKMWEEIDLNASNAWRNAGENNMVACRAVVSYDTRQVRFTEISLDDGLDSPDAPGTASPNYTRGFRSAATSAAPSRAASPNPFNALRRIMSSSSGLDYNTESEQRRPSIVDRLTAGSSEPPSPSSRKGSWSPQNILQSISPLVRRRKAMASETPKTISAPLSGDDMVKLQRQH